MATQRDKSSIYVDVYELFIVLYKLQFKAPKRDRPIIFTRLLDHCERIMANYSIAFDGMDKLPYINMMLGEVECLKVEVRLAIELDIIREADSTRVRELIVNINESVVKWRSYVVQSRQE